ncbi:MAG: glycine cleavage system aminomethyltransferase GcvT [bacterium]|nr:glycine cleavage system aminomethyltransferase GcvT [bacterium]
MKKTALYDIHKNLGAKLVEFAGFEMPVVYSGIIEEHNCVRNTVGVFDVSHMGEFIFRGDNVLEQLQLLTVNNAAKLEVGQVQYSAMCYPEGGIVDDLLVYRFSNHYMTVVNGACAAKDWDWIQKSRIEGAVIEDRSDDMTLIAVQGPESRNVIQKICATDISELKYYRAFNGKIAGKPAIISRTGYTGELGFELYFDNEYAVDIWNAVFEAGEEFGIKPVGLGARDSLRLEKNMCLYGNDITQDTNPIEAGLGWITKLDANNFIGKEELLAVKKAVPKRKLVSFIAEGRAVPRHGYNIIHDGDTVGEVTSGGFSPTLSKGIGMGYVSVDSSKIGTVISIEIRGKEVPAEIIKPPFVK